MPASDVQLPLRSVPLGVGEARMDVKIVISQSKIWSMLLTSEKEEYGVVVVEHDHLCAVQCQICRHRQKDLLLAIQRILQ